MSTPRPPATATATATTATPPPTSRKPSSSTTTTISSSNPSSKPPLSTHPTALLHPSCILTGAPAGPAGKPPHRITLAAHSIIQLRTRLDASYGSVTVGEGVVVGERCSIGFLSPLSPRDLKGSSGEGKEGEDGRGEGQRGGGDKSEDDKRVGCTIGRHVLIESGAVVEAASVGAYAVIGAGARLGLGCVIGEGAKIGPLVVVGAGEVVGAGVVVWGGGIGERRADEGMMGIGGSGVRGRKEAVEGLGVVYRRLWTGK